MSGFTGALRVLAQAVSAGLLLVGSASSGADEAAADPHAHHHHMMQAPPPVVRSTLNYTVPDITLVRSDGVRVNFAHELDDGRPVLLDFIYTTFTTIYTVMTQTFAEVQKRIGRDAAQVEIVSVWISSIEGTRT